MFIGSVYFRYEALVRNGVIEICRYRRCAEAIYTISIF